MFLYIFFKNEEDREKLKNKEREPIGLGTLAGVYFPTIQVTNQSSSFSLTNENLEYIRCDSVYSFTLDCWTGGNLASARDRRFLLLYNIVNSYINVSDCNKWKNSRYRGARIRLILKINFSWWELFHDIEKSWTWFRRSCWDAILFSNYSGIRQGSTDSTAIVLP